MFSCDPLELWARALILAFKILLYIVSLSRDEVVPRAVLLFAGEDGGTQTDKDVDLDESSDDDEWEDEDEEVDHEGDHGKKECRQRNCPFERAENENEGTCAQQ